MKDFEDTDREGAEHHMSYQHKPLTVAEIEELMERIETALALHHEGGPLAETPLKIPAGAYSALVDAKRLLSPLTPPTDAEVREAVARCEAHIRAHTGHVYSLGEAIATLLRAMQAPRLTGEQVDAVKWAYQVISMHRSGGGSGMCRDAMQQLELEFTEELKNLADAARAQDIAAFPEVFGKEG